MTRRTITLVLALVGCGFAAVAALGNAGQITLFTPSPDCCCSIGCSAELGQALGVLGLAGVACILWILTLGISVPPLFSKGKKGWQAWVDPGIWLAAAGLIGVAVWLVLSPR